MLFLDLPAAPGPPPMAEWSEMLALRISALPNHGGSRQRRYPGPLMNRPGVAPV